MSRDSPTTAANGVLLALLAWWTLRLGSGATTWCGLDYVNLAFHEAGHVLLRFAGSTMHYLGGTLAQLAAPALLGGTFLLRARKPFAGAFCLWWLGESLNNVSVYMADARDLRLPLVGGGDHDWNELFYRFGLLTEPSVSRVSVATHCFGAVVMTCALAWGAFFVLPARARDRAREAAATRLPWLLPALEP